MTQKMSVGEIMMTEEQIKAKVAELAEQLNRDYAGKDLIVTHS